MPAIIKENTIGVSVSLVRHPSEIDKATDVFSFLRRLIRLKERL